MSQFVQIISCTLYVRAYCRLRVCVCVRVCVHARCVCVSVCMHARCVCVCVRAVCVWPVCAAYVCAYVQVL